MARYADWREIGKGGHANVYRVLDTMLGRDVAIKMLNASANKNTKLVAGLREEVLISRDLRHRRICAIHDVYEGEEGVGIVMDFIPGIDAKDWLKLNRGDLTATAAQRPTFLRNVTETLVFAHERIVHRDLKPANVFLFHGDIADPVIMDFGISIATAVAGASNIGGTPSYMSPEQFEAPSKVDPRSDLFALGVMAYEMFTDQLPPTSLKDILRTRTVPRPCMEEIPPPSSFCPVLPAEFDMVVLSMMAYEQNNRPDSAKEVLAVLDSIHLLSETEALKRSSASASGHVVERVRVEGGSFYMGSQADSPMANEKPYRRLVLSPYLMDIHPVTNAAYRAFVRAVGRPLPPLIDDPVFGRDDHPVVGVTWEDARDYAAWVQGRLPTEAEWECAARAGQRFAQYPWGEEEPTATRANIDMIHRATTPVLAHPGGRNPLGLYDMCGNVWEWCSDSYDAGWYSRLRHDDRNPRFDKPKAPRCLRGGSFDSVRNAGRCAFRSSADPLERRRDVGFRVVYDL
ncbi:MAG: SUMF1/EgtB/PvdO family nonheme iron enzyme [Alphaproteobacteria bacterium]|nr:SUMF1/EgtB/PvdO family nonheme iron enzyme [Alphaproteobacteria bacterium]